MKKKIVIEEGVTVNRVLVDMLLKFQVDGFVFFAHKPHKWDLFAFNYHVSEYSTGACLSRHDTLENAINYALLEYNYRGKKEIKKSNQSQIKKERHHK